MSHQRKRRFIYWFVAFILTAGLLLAAQCGEEGKDLSISVDNLELQLGREGKVSSLKVKDESYETPENVRSSGFYLLEYPGKEMYEVRGMVRRKGKNVIQEATVEEAQIDLSVEYDKQKDYILVIGAIEDLSGKDRGIDLIYQLPVSASGWYWWDDIIQRREIEGDIVYSTSIYPLGCVSSKEEGGGVALAVSAHHPSIYSVEYDSDKKVLLIRFKFGLTQDAKPKLKGKAPFGFLIYPVDSQWGFRDGLATYYRIYSDIFKRRATKDGLLLEQLMAEERAINPDWNPGYFSYCRTSEMKVCEEQERESLGIDDYLYVLPGQLEVKYLHSLPENYEQAMKTYRELLEGPPEWLTKENLMCSDVKIKPLIENVSLRDKEGKYVMKLRNTPWGGNSITFPINPDPDLYVDLKKKTFTNILLKKITKRLETHPTYDGVFSDSFHGWGLYLNYRRDHFRYADLPLTHDEEGNVYIYNTMAHREWLIELKGKINRYNAMVMGNGIRPISKQIFTTFLLDVLMVETHSEENFPWYRSMSYHKPFHVSRTGMKKPDEILHFLKRCGQYGLLPNRMASFEAIKETEFPPTRMSTEVEQVLAVTSYLKRDKDLIDKYIPVILKESQLGWEPVTYAVPSDPAIQIERFGPKDGRVLFSVYNKSDSEKTISLRVNTDALNISKINQAKGMISGKSITPENPLKLKLEAYELDVILIGKPFTE